MFLQNKDIQKDTLTRDYERCRFGEECNYDHGKLKDIAKLCGKMRDTKHKLDSLESKMKHSDTGNLAKDVDKRVEIFEKNYKVLSEQSVQNTAYMQKFKFELIF